MLEKIKRKILNIHGKAAAWFGLHPAVMAIVLALSIAFANELLSRRSFIQAVVFMFTRPLVFLCNAVIILVFEAIGLVFKKRSYMMALFSLLFLILGITNFIVRCFRQTPFSSMDFTLVKSVFPILSVYLSVAGLIAAAAGIIAVVIFLIIRWKKAKKIPVRKKYAAVTLASSLMAAGLLIGSGYLFRVFPEHFSNLSDAYRDYGFTYCFAAGIIDRGIDKPDDYDDKIKDVVSDILSTDETNESDSPPPDGSGESSGDVSDEPKEKYPNIIFVQLESFYDLKQLSGFGFSEDPVPVFSELKNNYPHGILTVPSIGAGTANTEFEVLTGMSLKWFGAGEYPYETVLQKTTCETICYNLASHGYTSHAVHNYKGNFYDRSNVFSHLGFNTFTPIEYMNGIKTNALGWAKDTVLTRYVMSALKSTEGPDFVYCITVQGHGKYPTEELDDGKQHILITDYPEEANETGFSYYVDQLHETDEFIGALISSVKDLGEDTMIVFFGDHIPNIGINEEWLPDGMTLYNTEYVIWSSRGGTENTDNITSYQLAAKVMSLAGMSDGVLTKLHQTWRDKDDYEIYLEMLEYDILYGECFAYGGSSPFKPTDLKLGIHDIIITDVSVIGESTYVRGENFTEASRIFLNGIMRTTEFLDENTLVLPEIEVSNRDVIKIVQITDGIFQLGQTEEYRINGSTKSK